MVGFTGLGRRSYRSATVTHPSQSLHFLPIPFSACSSAESTPVATEPSLSGTPIFTSLNPAIGVPQVRSANPPEKCDRAEAGKQRDPKPHASVMGPRGCADTDVLTVSGQRDDCPIQSFTKVPEVNGGVEVLAADLTHDGWSNYWQHLPTERHGCLPFLHSEENQNAMFLLGGSDTPFFIDGSGIIVGRRKRFDGRHCNHDHLHTSLTLEILRHGTDTRSPIIFEHFCVIADVTHWIGQLDLWSFIGTRRGKRVRKNETEK